MIDCIIGKQTGAGAKIEDAFAMQKLLVEFKIEQVATIIQDFGHRAEAVGFEPTGPTSRSEVSNLLP